MGEFMRTVAVQQSEAGTLQPDLHGSVVNKIRVNLHGRKNVLQVFVLATLLTTKLLIQPALPHRVRFPRLIEQVNILRLLASLALGGVANAIITHHEASRIFLRGLQIALRSHGVAAVQGSKLRSVPM